MESRAGGESVGGNDAIFREKVKLLMLRERELLSLRREQRRFEAWLSLAQYLAGLVDSAFDRDQALRNASEALKSKLGFQQVSFFNAVGRSLSAIDLDPDVETADAPLDERAIHAILGAKDGQSPAPSDVTPQNCVALDAGADDFLKSPPREGDASARPHWTNPPRFHRFLWHWIDPVAPPVLLVAGYDRERAEFYPPFDEADLIQFAMVGRALDFLLAKAKPKMLERHPASISHALTEREVEVSRLLARGKTNKEIGALLQISSRTVQSHVANIFDKLGVRNRAGAVSLLVEHQVAT